MLEGKHKLKSKYLQYKILNCHCLGYNTDKQMFFLHRKLASFAKYMYYGWPPKCHVTLVLVIYTIIFKRYPVRLLHSGDKSKH